MHLRDMTPLHLCRQCYRIANIVTETSRAYRIDGHASPRDTLGAMIERPIIGLPASNS
jgi:hypothetical protein